MPKRIAVTALVIGIFALAAALLGPTLIGATNDRATSGYEFTEGESFNVTDNLRADVQDIEFNKNDANITLTNTNTYNTSVFHLNVSETKTRFMDGYRINATLSGITDQNEATATFEYPPTFGWDDGAETFVKNMEIVFALVLFMIVLGGAWVVKP